MFPGRGHANARRLPGLDPGTRRVAPAVRRGRSPLMVQYPGKAAFSLAPGRLPCDLSRERDPETGVYLPPWGWYRAHIPEDTSALIASFRSTVSSGGDCSPHTHTKARAQKDACPRPLMSLHLPSPGAGGYMVPHIGFHYYTREMNIKLVPLQGGGCPVSRNTAPRHR